MLFFEKRKKSIALESNPFKKVLYMLEDWIDTFSPLPFRYLVIFWIVVIIGSILVYFFGTK